MAQIDFGPVYGPRIENSRKELKALLKTGEQDRTEEWKEVFREAMKGLESALYGFVINGCVSDGHYYGCFPELQSEYDPESYEKLEQKIEVLTKIAEMGPDGDYTSIDGFDDILEKQAPAGTEIRTIDH